MIVAFLFNLIVLVVGAVFSLLPEVSTLPTVAGYDIDAAMVSGMGMIRTISSSFWYLTVLFQGFLVIMGYYALKIGIRAIIGHRAPTG